MEILDVHGDNNLFDLITKCAHERALELLRGDNHVCEDELNRSLMAACQRGYTCIVQMLVERGANLNYRDINGNTPLLISIQYGFNDIAQFLFANNADVNHSNCAGNSALILSIGSSESREITANLLKQTGINIDHQNQDGYTAVMKATEVKDFDSLKILLGEYLNIDSTKTSASFFDKHKRHKHTSDQVSDCVSKWTTLEKTVNCKGENVLQIAKRCGIINVFQLVQEHIDTNISPLELAIRANYIESLHIFLDCDFIYADKNKKYLDDALKHIFQASNDRDMGDFNKTEIAMITALLKHGADVNTTWSVNAPVFDRKLYRSHRFETLSTSLVLAQSSLFKYGPVNPIQIAAKSGSFKVLELLLAFHAEVKWYDFQNSPLNIALSHGHIDCAKLLIQRGAIIDFNQAFELAVELQESKYIKFLIDNYKNEIIEHLKTSSNIDDILIMSVRKGSLEIIGQILDLGANINGVDGSDTRPLAESRNGEVAKFLIDRGADVNPSTQITDWTPLESIFLNRNITDNSVAETIQVLLENGAPANDILWCGETLLMVAAGKEGSTRVMQLLLDHGAELCAVDQKRNTALIHAVLAGCSQNVSFLLQLIKDGKEVINIDNYNGFTAVMHAVKLMNPTIIKILINHGAGVNFSDGNGNTALHLLLKTVKKEIGKTKYYNYSQNSDSDSDNDRLPRLVTINENYLNTMRMLLEHGAPVNVKDYRGQTPLMLACTMRGRVNVLQLLLDHGAELSEVDEEGNTALILAVRTCCSENVTFLLQFMKDRTNLVNVQNATGRTALMCAVRNVYPPTIEELIDQGADVNIKDREGNTALLHLLLTFDGYKDEIIKSLVQAGCDINWQNNDGLSPLMVAAKRYCKHAMCFLLDLGAEINAVSKTDDTKTALTHMLYTPYDGDVYFTCLKSLLERGASPSYIEAATLYKMIVAGQFQVVSKLIRCGLGPVSFTVDVIDCSKFADDIMYSSITQIVVNTAHNSSFYSPLYTALCTGKKDLAYFFVRNLFLAQSDLSLLGHNKLLRQHLERQNCSECLEILDEISTQPMSLFNLSFVAVSTAVGTAPGRELRVNNLPVPHIIKDKLLFKE